MIKTKHNFHSTPLSTDSKPRSNDFCLPFPTSINPCFPSHMRHPSIAAEQRFLYNLLRKLQKSQFSSLQAASLGESDAAQRASMGKLHSAPNSEP